MCFADLASQMTSAATYVHINPSTLGLRLFWERPGSDFPVVCLNGLKFV
jgi:hypothetical protein